MNELLAVIIRRSSSFAVIGTSLHKGALNKTRPFSSTGIVDSPIEENPTDRTVPILLACSSTESTKASMALTSKNLSPPTVLYSVWQKKSLTKLPSPSYTRALLLVVPISIPIYISISSSLFANKYWHSTAGFPSGTLCLISFPYRRKPR